MADDNPSTATSTPVNLSRFALVSLVVGICVLILKLAAWWVTGSVGLFSDAMESVVNIAAAIVAFFALRTAAKPPDERHHFGHGSAEYLSALLEGMLIAAAATVIVVSSIDRLITPQPLEHVGIGLFISVIASLMNAATAWLLIRVGRRHKSLALIADGKHLLTDLWTTGGVLVGVVAVALTGWERLDPLIALGVAVNILIVGFSLVRRSVSGLLVSALPPEDAARLTTVLAQFNQKPVLIHAVQSRVAGRELFVSLHVLVPGDWPVARGHDLCEDIESAVSDEFGAASVSTHLEPVEDPRSFGDTPPGAEHPLGPG